MVSVLIVDDLAFNRKQYKKMIKGMQWHTVGEAANGRDAIDKSNELKPELILMDIVMPYVDGITAIKEKKRRIQR